jgi:hypothetical protein
VVPSLDLPLVTLEGKIKTTPQAVLETRQIPRNNVAVVQWLIHWDGLTSDEATWEDADFVKKIFLDFFKATVTAWFAPHPVP